MTRISFRFGACLEKEQVERLEPRRLLAVAAEGPDLTVTPMRAAFNDGPDEQVIVSHDRFTTTNLSRNKVIVTPAWPPIGTWRQGDRFGTRYFDQRRTVTYDDFDGNEQTLTLSGVIDDGNYEVTYRPDADEADIILSDHFLLGDVNSDRRVNTLDLLMVRRKVSNPPPNPTLADGDLNQ